ncbi:MAG: NAD(P)-binding domain-containing protein, partial [Verrucomicrobiia bacterium]
MNISIIGLGYVGLPLALQFARSGVTVHGIDIDPEKIRQLTAGQTYLKHIPSEEIRAALQAGTFLPTTDLSAVARSEATLICVPTPLGPHREPDLSFVINTARSIAPHLRPGTLVVLESTTYPGTTDGELRAALEGGTAMVAGRDFHLAFSPEREDPGNPNSRVGDLPKIVGGLTPACTEKASALYARAI